MRFFVVFAQLMHLALSPLLRGGLETATHPLRPLQDSSLDSAFAHLSLALFI